MEGGTGWANVAVVIPNLDSNGYYIGPVEDIVKNRQLGLYAVGGNEAALLARNSIATLYSPLLVPQSTGYNSGNLLTGQCIFFVCL